MSHFWMAWLGGLLVAMSVGACSSGEEAPPRRAARGTDPTLQVALDVPLSCTDVALENEWGGGRCEKDGNGACGGVGPATSDCAHCCPAPLPGPCEEVAKSRGWARFTCEQGDGACNGFGDASSDCEVCCEAPATLPTSAQVAEEWGFEEAVCEKAGNGACEGVGPATSDCEHVCDAAPAVEASDPAEQDNDPAAPEPFVELDPPAPVDEAAEAEMAALDPDAPPTPEELAEESEDLGSSGSLVPPPPPAPLYCSQVAVMNNWPNPICGGGSGDSGRQCQSEGVETVDCDVCCAGEPSVKPSTYACGDTKCLRVAELDLSGVSSKKELTRLVKRLKGLKVRPMVVGLQNATSQQRRYVAKQLGLDHAQPSLKSDAGGTLGLLSVAPLDSPRVVAFASGGGKLLMAETTTRHGAIQLGTAAIPDSDKVAAAQVVAALGDEVALLMASAGPPSSASYRQLSKELVDTWDTTKWGGASRETHVLRTADWEDGFWGVTFSGEEATATGSAGLTTQDTSKKKSGGKATVRQVKTPKGGKKAKPTSTLRGMAELAGRKIGTIFRADTRLVQGNQCTSFYLKDLLDENGAFLPPNGELPQEHQAIHHELRHEANLVLDRFHTVTVSEYFGFLAKDPASQFNFSRVNRLFKLTQQAGSKVKPRYHPLRWDNPGEGENTEYVCLVEDAATHVKKWGDCSDPTKVKDNEKAPGKGFQLPPWFIGMVKEGKTKEARALLEDYEQKVISEFAPLVTGGWIVVNEAIGTNGLPRKNSTLIKLYDDPSEEKYAHIIEAFSRASKLGARGPLLYNDYGCEFTPASVKNSFPKKKKTLGVRRLVQAIVDSGVPFDGVGFQMHIRDERIKTEKAVKEMAEKFRNNVRWYGSIKKKKKHKHPVDVYVTELDIQGAGATVHTRTRFFEAIAEVCATEPNCKGIAFWGASDANKWTNEKFLPPKKNPQDCPPRELDDNGSQLYSRSKPGLDESPGSFPVNASSFCSAVRGFKARVDKKYSGWSPNLTDVSASDDIYECLHK